MNTTQGIITAESEETFDEIFSTTGLTAKKIMARVEKEMRLCRIEASNLAKELLLRHGYFNGEITQCVYHDDKDKTVRVEVKLRCFGLPQVRIK